MRFIADGMLGRLARWLRILGYDVIYSARLDDAELARMARIENRILLTRDTGLVKRKGVKFVLVKSDDVYEQLRQLLDELQLSLDAAAFSRCSECNTPLVDVHPESVASEIPPYVLATQTRFRRCPGCGRVYWRGTHWEKMRQKIREVGAR